MLDLCLLLKISTFFAVYIVKSCYTSSMLHQFLCTDYPNMCKVIKVCHQSFFGRPCSWPCKDCLILVNTNICNFCQVLTVSFLSNCCFASQSSVEITYHQQLYTVNYNLAENWTLPKLPETWKDGHSLYTNCTEHAHVLNVYCRSILCHGKLIMSLYILVVTFLIDQGIILTVCFTSCW